MAVVEYYQVFLILPLTVILFLFFFTTKNSKKSSIPRNYPIIGMLPSILRNTHRLHEFITDIMKDSGGTLYVKGPIFSNMDMVVTCDPVNIHHILIKKFSNYPKGPEFNKIFDILGDGIFRADFGLWQLHRKTTLSLMDSTFYLSLQNFLWEKVETGLSPILDSFAVTGLDFDMQDVLGRLSFDVICRLYLNHDPLSLSPNMPNIPCEKALNELVGPLMSRHLVPEPLWRLQKWLNIGPERKLSEARRAFDDFIYPHVFSHEERENSMFESFKKAYKESENIDFSRELKDFLRDTFLNLLIAGRDSMGTGLTWFFYLIAQSPSVEAKIREEMERVILKKGRKWRYFEMEECKELTYLHAALCETMRLYPPIAIEHKVAMEGDMLPGQECHVDRNEKVIMCFYSTGRMESVWGGDCLEFRPERWLGRGIISEPSYKFPAFNAGPRTCVGKKMAFIQMKMVAAFILHHFNLRLVEGHPVVPTPAVILKAQHGLRVRLTRRK